MELKVVTINCWGLYIDAKYVKERFKYIARELEQYDIACLQEVWLRDDYKDFVARLSSSLPYSHHFLSSVVGSGLCVFSRYPIVSIISHQFRVTGGIRIFYDGEVFGGKGVLCCRVDTPQGVVAIFNTHMNPRCRESQMFELMQFVHHIRGDHPVIVCGDFNTKDTHTSYQLMTECLGLSDVYSDEPEVMTCDKTTNIFTKPGLTDKRIDFIFHSEQQLKLRSRRLTMSGKIPGKDYPYSDHEGVEAVFNLNITSGEKGQPMKVDGLRALHRVSKEIETKMNKQWYYNIQYGKMVVAGLLFCGLFLSLLLSAINETFASYHVHWVTTPIAVMFGSLIMLFICLLLNEVQLFSGMTSNIDEINNVLQYNSFQNNKGN